MSVLLRTIPVAAVLFVCGVAFAGPAMTATVDPDPAAPAAVDPAVVDPAAADPSTDPADPASADPGAAAAPPSASISDDVLCDPKGTELCIVKTTGMPLRLLMKPGGRLHVDMDENSAIVGGDIDPFSVLYAYQMVDVSYDADNFTASGWYRAGRSLNTPEGYVKADDVVPWKQALALAFTNPGPTQRRPVLMFRNQQALDDELAQIDKDPAAAAKLYDEVAAKNVPEGIVSREGNAWVDINKSFYLLPILQYEKLDAIAPDMLGIQLAALTNQGRAQQAKACDLHESDADACLREQQGAAIDNLALDVVFVIDTTASMQPNIDAVTSAVRETAQTLSQKLSDPGSLKFGIVGYRDDVEASPGLEYKVKNFTTELVGVDAFQKLLDSGVVKASQVGSDDWAEDVFSGMQEGIKSNWDPEAARVIILIGDASSHPVGDPKNANGLSETSIKDLAAQQNVYVTSIYIAGSYAQDLTLARPQFEGMATGNSENGTAFSIVNQSGSGGTNLEGGQGGSMGLEASLRDALGKIAQFLSTGNFASVVQENTDAADKTGQAIMSAVRAAFVDYIGSSATPPSNITAWVLDRDLTDFSKHAFDVKVMLQRGEVEELKEAISQILGKFREGESSSVSFIQSVKLSSTASSYDLKISETQPLADSPIIPQWIKSLPYKSEVLTISVEEFRNSSADARANFESRLERLIAFYDDVLIRTDAWVQLNKAGTAEDAVYMMSIGDLP